VVTICTASLTFNNSTFCPHTLFTHFVYSTDILTVKHSLRSKKNTPLHHGSPTCGPPSCIVRPADIFVSCAHTIKITQTVARTTYCQLSTFGLPTRPQYRVWPYAIQMTEAYNLYGEYARPLVRPFYVSCVPNLVSETKLFYRFSWNSAFDSFTGGY